MSGPSRNETAPSRAGDWRRLPFDFDPAFRVNLLIFFAPLLWLSLEVLLHGGKPFFASGVFLAGSFLELLLDGLLRRRVRQRRLSPRRRAWLQYLNHTVLGLPMTIYLASSALSPAAALLRLLPTLHILCRSRSAAEPLTHLLLFATGYLVYAAGLRYAWPGESEILTAAGGLALGLLLLWRERLALGGNMQIALAKRAAVRERRRANTIEARESSLLEATLLTPDRVRRYRKHLPVSAAAGDMLCVVVAFPDLNAAAADFASRGGEAGLHAGAALAEFEHEWDLCVDHYRRGLSAAGLLAPLGDDRIFGLELLEPETGGGRADRSAAQLERRVLELILSLRELLAFSDRSRRALESRGRRGWSAVAAIARGPGSLVRRGPANPAPVGRGRVFAELAAHLESWNSQPDGRHAGSIHVHPDLAAPVRRFFVPADAVPGAPPAENWFSPGYLQAEYSINGAGVEPLPDLFERLRYGVDRPANES